MSQLTTSMFRVSFRAFKFARLVLSCDIRYDFHVGIRLRLTLVCFMELLLSEFHHVCTDVGLFYFRLVLRACSVVEILYIYEIKTKNNYRSLWCIQTYCRSVSYRQLNISSEFKYTPTSTTY